MKTTAKKKNLSDTENKNIPSGKGKRVAVVISEWNTPITESLKKGAVNTLKKYGVESKNINVLYVPGSFELTLGCQKMLEADDYDAVLALGCIIQGETRHFEFICNAVAQGITQLNINYNIPVIFGVLTPDTMQQAIDRAGGKHGNKGDEAAITALKMMQI
jgi:6,7-dimethyl-8-ribityllumazine synthase